MKIQVKFFGRSQELVGKEELEAEIEEGASVADLCLNLAKDFPELEDDFHTLMIAVNAVQADWEYILSGGDKVDFISTLGGG
ncbi:MoaD/ThiS family protein [Chloroflexota bacterium]